MTRDRDDRRRDFDDHDDHDDDRGGRDFKQRRPPRVEIRFSFAVNGGPAPDEVHGDRFRAGTTVSTSKGPHRVVEVYWLTETHGRVLLRPIPTKKKKSEEKKTVKPSASPQKERHVSWVPSKSFPR